MEPTWVLARAVVEHGLEHEVLPPRRRLGVVGPGHTTANSQPEINGGCPSSAFRILEVVGGH